MAPNQQSIYRDVYRDRQNRFRHTPLADLRVPLPAEYVAGFDEQSFEANPRYPGFGFTFYMAGELSKLGSPLYYLYALVLKSTPGALLLCALGLWGIWRVRLPLTTEAFLLLPPIAMLLAMSLLTEINLGVRYTLVCFPYAMVALGRVAKLESPRGVRVLVPLLLALHAGSALWIAPHFLAYFNPFAGGPASGHERLVDSNLDWGQDLLALAEFDKEREEGEPLHVALYTNLSPAASGLDLPLIPRDPAALSAAQRRARDPNELPALVPGLYALSVNYAVGLPFRMLFEERVFSVPRNAYSYLRRLEPVGRVGYSIWLYRLSQKDCDQLNSELGFERGGER